MSQTRNNLTYCTIDGIAATPWFLASLPGSFLTAGLLNAFFDVGPFWFGLISAMPALANAIHIVLVPAVAKFMRVRDLTVSQGWLNLGVWLGVVIGIAFLPEGEPAVAGLFFTIGFAAISLTSSLVGVGWMAWMTEIVPSRVRGRYLGVRNRLCNISTLVFMVASLIVLNIWDASRWAYVALLGVTLAARTLSVLVLHLIWTKDPSGGALTNANWAKELSGLRKQGPLLRFIAFGTITGFFTALMGAAGPLYALEELGASPADFTGFSIAATISGAVFVRIWGTLIDRHGAVPIIIICFAAWRLGDIVWTVISPETLMWMYPLWVWGGAMATGYLIAAFTLLLKLIPKESRMAGISLNLTLTSIAGAIAPAIGGWVLSQSTGWGWDLIATYRWLFAIAIACSLVSVLILYKFKEPETDPTRNTIHGAMRTLRNLTVNQGVSFLSHTILIRRKRPKQ